MAPGDTPVIRFGIAGMGVGRGRAERTVHTAGAQLSAIFDHRPENARKLAEGWGCQAAAIFTPSGTHGDLGRAIELHGSGGTIALHDGEITTWRFVGDEPEAATGQTVRSAWEPTLPDARPRNIIEDVVAALTRGTALACPPQEGRKSVAILEAVYRSAARGGAEEQVAP